MGLSLESNIIFRRDSERREKTVTSQKQKTAEKTFRRSRNYMVTRVHHFEKEQIRNFLIKFMITIH